MNCPHVGIFWFVPSHSGHAFLLTDRTPLPKAEAYGDCLTHAQGHYEYWSNLARFGEAGLSTRGLPTIPVQFEYEEFPRGRVVFRVPDNRFTIFADRKLFARPYIGRVIADFGLPVIACDVYGDAHYRSTLPAPPCLLNS